MFYQGQTISAELRVSERVLEKEEYLIQSFINKYFVPIYQWGKTVQVIS
jgi:hypothetical protein